MSEQRAETDTSNPFVARMERCASWVNERWRRTEQDELAFPGIAKEALESTPVDQFSIESLVRWAIDTDRLPMTGGDDTFGEPPLTVAIGPGFKIDVLFWSEGTTSVHQHMFAGAFRVLEGISVHCEYGFACERRVNSRLRFGRLDVTRAELLRPGAVRGIEPGDAFTHAVLHLGRPSVTLLIRTAAEDEFKPQNEYLFPGISLHPTRTNPNLHRRFQLLMMLARTGNPGHAAAVERLLEGAGVETFVQVLKYGQLLRAQGFAEVYERCARRFEEADLLIEAYRHRLRKETLFWWCRRVSSPEHRFFLAALTNVFATEPLVELIAEEVDGDPIQAGLRWFDELVELQRRAPHMPVLVDAEHVDEARERLRDVLRGAPRSVGNPAIALTRPFESRDGR